MDQRDTALPQMHERPCAWTWKIFAGNLMAVTTSGHVASLITLEVRDRE